VSKPYVRPIVRHVFHQYTLRIPGARDDVARQLGAAGIGTAVFYPLSIHQQKVFRDLGYNVRLPVSEQVSREVLSLPVHPTLSERERAQIVEAVNSLQVAIEVGGHR